jgi:hypothetical protein
VEKKYKKEREENKKLKQRLIDAHEWVHNSRRMRLKQMFDNMPTKMWEANVLQRKETTKDMVAR